MLDASQPLIVSMGKHFVSCCADNTTECCCFFQSFALLTGMHGLQPSRYIGQPVRASIGDRKQLCSCDYIWHRDSSG